MALKDKLMTLEDFKAVRDVDVASNSAQFTEIKADLDTYGSSFVEAGGADKYISNLKIFGEPAYIRFSNIRNRYVETDGTTSIGFTIGLSNDSGSTSIKTILNYKTAPSPTGHFRDILPDGRTYEFDYDLSSIPEGSRDVDIGLSHLVSRDNFYDIINAGEITKASIPFTEDLQSFVINAIIYNSNPPTMANNGGCRSLAIPCIANTTYNIEKCVSGRFRGGYIIDEYATGIQVYGGVVTDSAKSMVIHTGSNAEYIVVEYYDRTVDSLTDAEILETINISYIGDTPSAVDKVSRAIIHNGISNVYSSSEDYNDGDYVINGSGVFRFIDSHTAGTAWAGTDVVAEKDADAVEVSISDIAMRDESFILPGGAGRHIKNLKIYTDEPFICAISNIRNGYVQNDVAFTGVSIIKTNKYFTVITDVLVQFELPDTSGHFMGTHDGVTYEFDYDLSSIPVGSRDADYAGSASNVNRIRGLRYRVKPECFYSAKSVYDYLMFGAGFMSSFGVVGDSYASGSIYTPDGQGNLTPHAYYELSWPQVLARKYGNTCVNFSSGGLSTRTWLTAEYGLQKLQSSDPLPLYICNLGINDLDKLGTSYIGTVADMLDNFENNPDTFFGNYGKIIGYIQRKSPDAKVIMMTIAIKYNSAMEQYNTAIHQIAEKYGFPCITLTDDLFYRKGSIYQTFRVVGHPTAAIYAGMALANERLIDKCVAENMEYFKYLVPLE